MFVKNTFGCSVIPNPKFVNPDFIGQCRGSSLDRKDEPKKPKKQQEANEEKSTETDKQERWRSLSPRTKGKIRKKLFAFFGLHKRLTFLTLTFANEVSDTKAVEVLGKFLNNIKKQDKKFEFLWVAERQTKNPVFPDNIHFHLITNKFWKIDKCWEYWLNIQVKNGIHPRDENYKPSSAFDVKAINSNNAKGIACYLTKYVTKNSSKFLCQVWNCSKKISQLYTDFYSDFTFLKNIERLEKETGLYVKRVAAEYCNILFYELNKNTIKLCEKIHQQNKIMWNNEK